MQTEKAFIAANKYLEKTFLPFGAGVVASFDEETAMLDTERIKNLDVKNEWYEILIPERNTFLDLDKLLEHNPKQVLKSLFSTDSLSMLFYDETQEFHPLLEKEVEESAESNEEKANFARAEIRRFYDDKIRVLKKNITVDSLIQFITGRAKNKDILITSSFLFMSGINGVVYENNGKQRILIFDARRSIKIERLKNGILKDSKYSA